MTTETLSKLAADAGADLPETLPPRELVEIAITESGVDLKLANGDAFSAAMLADLPLHIRSRPALPLTGDALARLLIPEVQRSGRLPPAGATFLRRRIARGEGRSGIIFCEAGR
jgi:hypothetical protein